MASTNPTKNTRITLSEDWLSVLIALFIILLSAIGLLGPNGFKIVF